MRQHIEKLFNVKGMVIDRWEWENDRTFVIAVRRLNGCVSCPRCECTATRVHQRHRRRVEHARMDDGTVIVLLVTKRRFACRVCCRPFTERFPDIPPWARTTTQRKIAIVRLLRSSTCTEVGRQVVRSPHTVARFCRECAPPLAARFSKSGEIRLGVDGHTMRQRKEVVTINDVRCRRPITLLPDNHKKTLCSFFKQIPPQTKQRISEVAIDMSQGNAAAIRETLGARVRIVVDHFHVIQEVNRALDDVRCAYQSVRHLRIPKLPWLKGKERLKPREYDAIVAWSDTAPDLFRLWVLKEDLRTMYDQRTRRRAARRMDRIITALATMESPRAQTLGRTLIRWREEILNFFHHRTTNAYTEGLNRKLKLLQRTAYGFRNFDNYLLRATLVLIPFTAFIHHTI